jgi:hypothetical protein
MKLNVFKSKDKTKHDASEKAADKNTSIDNDIASIVDAAPAKSHGPSGELSLDSDEQNNDITLDEINETTPGKPKAIIDLPPSSFKTATITGNGAEPASTQPMAATPEPKAAGGGAAGDLNSLFAMDEEVENPLAALIASLPDVTIRELLDDLDEIHRIIKEWKPNQGGGGIPR